MSENADDCLAEDVINAEAAREVWFPPPATYRHSRLDAGMARYPPVLPIIQST